MQTMVIHRMKANNFNTEILLSSIKINNNKGIY